MQHKDYLVVVSHNVIFEIIERRKMPIADIEIGGTAKGPWKTDFLNVRPTQLR